jgi:hypothetical protein
VRPFALPVQREPTEPQDWSPGGGLLEPAWTIMPPPDKPFTGGERPVQRMNYENNAADREAVAGELTARGVSAEVANQLIDAGGIGTVTIRTLSPALISRLLPHTDAAHLIVIVLALAEAKIRRLDELGQNNQANVFAPFIALAAGSLNTLLDTHAGINLAGLNQIGAAAGGVAVNNRALADLVQLANGVQALTAAQVLALAGIHAGINTVGLIQIGTAAGGVAVNNRALADLVLLANGLQALTAAQVLALAGIHAGIGVAGLIQIGLAQAAGGAGARPLGDLVTLANNLQGLTAAELAPLALLNVGGALGEYIVQDGIQQNRTFADLSNEVHANATAAERRVVANHAALRAVIRVRMAGGEATALIATLLEGSLTWPGPSGPDDTQQYQIELTSDFATWIRGGVENANRPAVAAASTMNCWEGVMFAGYLAGRVTYAALTTAHQNAAQDGQAANDPDAYYLSLSHFLNADNSALWDPTANPAPALPIGNIVFFTDEANPTDDDKLDHVAISIGGAGAAARIMSLWDQPGNITSFQNITVGQLLAASPSDVYIAPNPW